MNDMLVMLGRWQLDVNQVRDQVYRAPTPRERERWHALWLLARGWSAEQVAEALGRDLRTIADWTADFQQRGPAGVTFEQSGSSPPRPQPGATSRTKGGGAGRPERSRSGVGQLELEGGTAVRAGAL